MIFFVVCSSGNCIVVLGEDNPRPNSWFLVTENLIFILFHQLLVSDVHLAHVSFIRCFRQLDRDPNATTVKTTCSCSELRQARAKDLQVLPGDDNSVDMSHRKQCVAVCNVPRRTKPNSSR